MQKKKRELVLENGSKIAVVGGGPAGSFFSVFAFDLAKRRGIDIQIDIYEPKNFSKKGLAGCNQCGGIISESLVKMLSAEGIVIPLNVIRRNIESYTLHLEQDSTVINTPYKEQRIVSIFRGAGPLGSTTINKFSFDGFLQQLCEEKGAKIYNDKVTDFEREPDGISIITKSSKRKYDLVIGASGLNPRTLKLFQKIIPDYKPPKTTKTFICEFHLGFETINTYFGNSMHVFLLNLPHIKFGALIPKNNYVTLVLLGSEINKEIVDSFTNSESVRACFPKGIELNQINPCQCFPSINIKNGKNPYSDRVVLIGDSSSSKLYKNGIGAAYITGKAAANTVIFNGIAKENFKRKYQPVCSGLNIDNRIGKLIFFITKIIQESPFLKKGLFKMIVNEQGKKVAQRKMSSIMWDTFTGSAPYKGIFFRSLNPAVLSSLLWNILTAVISPIAKETKDKSRDKN
jgi:flavin-dependent dehydrogenase